MSEKKRLITVWSRAKDKKAGSDINTKKFFKIGITADA
jgi:hypothetical protein